MGGGGGGREESKEALFLVFEFCIVKQGFFILFISPCLLYIRL